MTTAHEVTFGEAYVDAVRYAAASARNRYAPEFVGPQGAARILGVSRQREMILRKRPDYPPPATHVDGDPSRPLWHAATIREYDTTRKATR